MFANSGQHTKSSRSSRSRSDHDDIEYCVSFETSTKNFTFQYKISPYIKCNLDHCNALLNYL